MSVILAVAAQAYDALDLSEKARHELEAAADLLAEAAAGLATALAGSGDPEMPELVGRFSGLGPEVAVLLGYAIEGDRLARAWIAHEVGTSPGRFPVAAREPPARWRGQDAVAHARDRGSSIGRDPRGSKKQPIREVRSLRVLDELFTALARGAVHVEKPTYPGWFYLFADRSTIGYRTKSATTIEPTIEIVTAAGFRLKIHVNTEGWDEPCRKT